MSHAEIELMNWWRAVRGLAHFGGRVEFEVKNVNFNLSEPVSMYLNPERLPILFFRERDL